MIRFLSVLILVIGCASKPNPVSPSLVRREVPARTKLTCGADQLDVLLPLVKDKRVGLVVNHTSLVGATHLVDTLKSSGVNIVKIFGPEHGFRGNAADGEHVNNSLDVRTGIPVVSLYGKNRKPTTKQFSDLDVVIFDIQDVGTRFYTYISTMHYVMEACAESKKKLIILDRPNPNAFVDGPINEKPLQSFVAMHAIPIAHGLTVAELAQMINGESWLTNGVKCELEIISLKNWKRSDNYSLPIRPSPNLPNDQAVRLYPFICLFEGTVISLGRGTPSPFQVLGNPELKNMDYQFTPVTIPGVAVKPPHENKVCYGLDLRNVVVERKIDLSYLSKMYQAYLDKEKFFLPYFDILAGNTTLRQQIKDGLTEEQIRKSWKVGLDAYKKKREKYLLYQ
jgi:uncharacterized protein YbbC (DUF1343 family)